MADVRSRALLWVAGLCFTALSVAACSSTTEAPPVDAAVTGDAGELIDGDELDAGGDEGTEPCVPNTCKSLAMNCGKRTDGCGATLDCGTCTAPEVCGGGGVTGRCGCTAKTCSVLGVNCGTVSNGCGGTLDCGTCASPQTCGGAGITNVCGCTKTTCAAAGKNCGTMPDGCGGTPNCGTCTSPQTCGGGGVANVCGAGPCVPTTCAAAGKNCGTISDGCGATLDCGTCTSPQTCGGGGPLNVCGCTKKTCTTAGASCGAPPDGCGGTLSSCGTCTAPDTCGGGATPYVCGCTKATCDVGAECGSIADGCGGTVSCGTCGTGTLCNTATKKCDCVKTTCAAEGKVCGTISDACGGTLTCAGCPGALTCGTGDVCGFTAPTTPAVCGLDGWCYIHPSPQPNTLTSVWAIASNNVWSVGANGTIIRYDGAKWSGVSAVLPVTFTDVWASSATDLWVVGKGTVLHGDGAGKWTYLPVPSSASTATLRAIHGTSASNVWFVGGDGGSTLLRWNGTALVSETAPTGAGTLFDVWHDGTTTWLVGAGGTFRYDGATWTKDDTSTTSKAVWAADGEVFVAGDGGLIKRKVGGVWVTMAQPTTSASYSKMIGVSVNEIYAVGTYTYSSGGTPIGVIDKWNGTSWGRLRDTSPLYGVAPAAGLDLVAVGADGLIETRTGTTWSAIGGASTANLSHVSGFASNDLWFGGNRRMHWNGSQFDVNDWASEAVTALFASAPATALYCTNSYIGARTLTTGTTERYGTYYSVWGSSSSDVWATGTGLTSRRLSGVWSNVTNPLTGTTAKLNAVWGAAADDVWAGGDLGYMMHWNGSAWSLVPSGFTGTITRLWGRSSNDVWALTSATTMLHWDGTSWSSVTAPTYTRISGSVTDLYLIGAGGSVSRRSAAGATTSIVPSLSIAAQAVHVDESSGAVWLAGNARILRGPL